MKTWMPLVVAVVLALLINAYPAFMAVVVGSEEWITAGWALYFITVPLGAVLVLVGAVISLVLLVRRRK